MIKDGITTWEAISSARHGHVKQVRPLSDIYVCTIHVRVRPESSDATTYNLTSGNRSKLGRRSKHLLSSRQNLNRIPH